MTLVTDIPALQARLQQTPDDEQARVDLALALALDGQQQAAAEILLERLRNLTAHEEPTLPCLCKRCLVLDLGEAEAQGVKFVRRFAAARGRVLFFWVPEELAADRGVLRGVASDLRKRLKDPA